MPKFALAAQIEAILFTQTEPVSLTQLAQWLDEPEADVTAHLAELGQQLEHRGIRLAEHAGTYRLTTAPEASQALAKLPQATARSELSGAALETLAAIAYRGPITLAELSELRGVASDTMVRNLVARGLVESAGRQRQAAGMPTYRVGLAFYEQFGLTSLADLPPVDAEPVNGGAV